MNKEGEEKLTAILEEKTKADEEASEKAIAEARQKRKLIRTSIYAAMRAYLGEYWHNQFGPIVHWQKETGAWDVWLYYAQDKNLIFRVNKDMLKEYERNHNMFLIRDLIYYGNSGSLPSLLFVLAQARQKYIEEREGEDEAYRFHISIKKIVGDATRLLWQWPEGETIELDHLCIPVPVGVDETGEAVTDDREWWTEDASPLDDGCGIIPISKSPTLNLVRFSASTTLIIQTHAFSSIDSLPYDLKETVTVPIGKACWDGVKGRFVPSQSNLFHRIGYQPVRAIREQLEAKP